MALIVILLVTTIGLTLILKFAVTPRYGVDVVQRFLERASFIPSRSTPIELPSLQAWLADPANKQARVGYVVPVIIPFDIGFLISLGLLLGAASVALAGGMPALAQIPRWIWWAVPACYMIADLIEDGLIALVLTGAIELDAGPFFLLGGFKLLKLATVTAAIGQVAFLGCLRALLFVFPAAP